MGTYLSLGGRRWVAVLAVGALVTAGCGACSLRVDRPAEGPPPTVPADDLGVTLSTDKGTYAEGEDVLLRIENGLDRPIYYLDRCSIHLCQQVEDDWVCEMKECFAETIAMKAGGYGELVFPGSLTGTTLKYRLDYATTEEDGTHIAGSVDSNEFTIGSASGLALPTVPDASLHQFLQRAETGDYHQIVSEGKAIFTEGAYIADHAELLAPFPCSEVRPGHLRYTLHSFGGEASVGEVYLILQKGSGRIIEFNYIEAFLE
jgi:hypothetical protein